MRKKNQIEQFVRSIRRRIFKMKYGQSFPYIYGLLTGVIDNDHRYYYYDEIDRMVEKFSQDESRLGENDLVHLPDRKVLYCIYRLVNELQPRKICVLGADVEIYQNVLASVDTTAVMVSYDEYLKEDLGGDSKGLIFCNGVSHDKLMEVFENIHIGDVVITHGLHWKRCGKIDWPSLVKDSMVTASMESKEMGIGFTDPNFRKQNFYIKY
ncbi:hypothetical protein K5X82_16355 [Halosquirtibacter xylanolyticus]|uniref:hypothetical protein n=1 Tax=Halosquirtibacter xylanolyticus TaxID=3374599 RepID=UPI00374A88B0|nr:hypothetical protein K5X82_16355 [Prolixibacteraceae bacterium]